ncbi:MAG TPA: hypothetical protein VK508_06685 [Cyclobacteriaceae bacterium]|nr:hypothetical protein [Cyclobacteriaceae bacterium]
MSKNFMLMKRHLNFTLPFFAAAVLLSNNAAAQFDYNAILPSSPTAAALGQYGSVPISYYTGTPNISIPLAAIKGSELGLDISLSYMAKGVRVDENASWVGTGWSLNCTGVITRTVRGVEDGTKPRASLPLPSTNTSLKAALTDIQAQTVDPEPDLFHFNYPGGAGSFVLDENGEAVIDDAKDIRIKRVVITPPKFIITSENGTQFIFDEVEIAYFNSGASGNSSIYLTKIISPTGKETIDFDYVYEATRYLSLSRPLRRIRPDNQSVDVYAPFPGDHLIAGRRLESIATNFGSKITFVPDSQPRQDLGTNDPDVAPKALKEVVISNQFDQVKKIFVFDYETIETSSPYTQYTGNDPIVGQYSAYANYRLYLKSVAEMSSDRFSTNPPYEFTYTGRTSDNKDRLPNKLSPAQDHWGYFNGSSNNNLWPGYSGPFALYDPTFSLPTVVCDIEPIIQRSRPSFTIAGANRAPSFPESGYGTIHSIEYPTGGKTVYDFGAQKYLYETTRGLVTQKQNFQIQVNVGAESTVYTDSKPDTVNYVVATFSFEFAVTCRNSFPPYEPKACGTSDSEIDPVKFGGNSVGLYDAEGAEIIAVKWDNPGFKIYKNGFLDHSYGIVDPDMGGYVTLSIPSLEFYPGIYTLKAIKDPDADRDVLGWFGFEKTVTIPELTETYAKTAGGLRINSVESFDEHGSSVAKKTYDYGFGVLMDGLKYSRYVYEGGGLLQRCPGLLQPYADPVPYLEVSSGSHTELGYTQGSSMAYQSVTEKQAGNGSATYEYTTSMEFPDYGVESDKITYFFWDYGGDGTIKVDYPTDGPQWPFIPSNNFDRKRGFLRKITYRNEAGQPLKVVEHFPVMNDIDEVYGVRTQVLRPDVDWLFSTFKYSSGFVNVDSTAETAIVPSPHQELTKETKYFYEGVNHHFLTKTVTRDSDSSELVTEFRYPDDYVSIVHPDHVITQMKKGNSHMVGSPIETRTFRNGVRTGGTLNMAGKFSKTSGGYFIAPKRLYRMKDIASSTGTAWSADPTVPDTTKFDLEAEFTFDGAANIAKVRPRDQIKRIYLWEAGNPNPVGDVVNAEQGTSFCTSFETTGTEQTLELPAKTGFRYLNSGSYNFSTAASFSPSNPSALKMSYWFWNGIKWVFSGELSFSNSISSSGSRLDDIRVFPAGARMTTYTYDTAYGINSTTDSNNRSTYFIYDNFGRLSFVKDNDGNIVKKQSYHYAVGQ